jgi:asparagine synthetase B (glutamine-hydrolysing)
MFRDEYFQEGEEGVMGEGGYSRFKEDFEKITGVFEHKTKSDKKELIAQGNTRAKSSDYGMITQVVTSVDPALYRTEEWIKAPSKVVFSGLGADEVFGGYSRYKTAFERGGFPEVEAEMGMDLDRLWHRNMGRDDRAISDNGRETRFPFLDTSLLRYLSSNVPTETLVDFDAFRGLGDKKLLREVARE